MTFKGLLRRIVFTGLLLFLIHPFVGELGSSIYLALMPLFFYEILRPR
jgi:hypothetical protein